MAPCLLCSDAYARCKPVTKQDPIYFSQSVFQTTIRMSMLISALSMHLYQRHYSLVKNLFYWNLLSLNNLHQGQNCVVFQIDKFCSLTSSWEWSEKWASDRSEFNIIASVCLLQRRQPEMKYYTSLRELLSEFRRRAWRCSQKKLIQHLVKWIIMSHIWSYNDLQVKCEKIFLLSSGFLRAIYL